MTDLSSYVSFISLGIFRLIPTVTPVSIVLTWTMIAKDNGRRTRNARQKEIEEIMIEMRRMLNKTAKRWMLASVSANLFQAQTLQVLRHTKEATLRFMELIVPLPHRMITRTR